MPPETFHLSTEETRTTLRDWLNDARLDGQEDHYAGKRTHPRVTWPIPVTARIMTGPRAGDVEYTALRDVSPVGVAFRLRRAIPVGDSVRVTCDTDERSVEGKVIRCTETVGGYVIGVVCIEEEDGPAHP